MIPVRTASHPRLATLIALAVAILFYGCGGGGGSGQRLAPGANNPPPPVVGVVSTSPHVPGAPYANVLRRCTYAGDNTEACTLGTLPFLGMEFSSPTIADVMERTLVSHAWMGNNFAQVLEDLPADVLPLFRSITAVVIASDVRPAHYDPDTGAIYLDPDFLWLTVAERDTVSDEPDPRSNFGLDLQFQMPWRYVRDNQRLTVFINADGSRDRDQIVEIMGYLLYHELAHAVDFMHPDRLGALSPNLTVLQALNREPPVSAELVRSFPLNSGLLKELADVSFLGESSTQAQRDIEPEELVDPFVNDGAVQYYSYTHQFEDFATLYESAMMKWRFGYDKDTGITNRPASGGTDSAIVAWGTRGRLGEQTVAPRVRYVGQRIYPGNLAEFEAFLDGEPASPPRMRIGETWAKNLILDTAAPTAATLEVTRGIDKTGRRADHFLERVPIR